MVYFLDAYRPPPDLKEDRLCHHFDKKITRDVPIETLLLVIKEIKEGYPQIKHRLAKGGKQEAAPADQAGAAAGREKAEAAVLEATEKEAMEIAAKDHEEEAEQETAATKKRKSDAATKKRSAPAAKKRAQPSPKGKKPLDGNDDEEVNISLSPTKGKKISDKMICRWR